ncbi:endonuclease/exonuclease/phosphatase family protein [Dokdonella sp. MW10]|uniref:endonuclease/exonuclease/phosphatase family protein n=1 Tax=Dokdonella sp. MW10 TaxID=2992926 RepID=UPI003F7F90B9
MVHMLAAAMLTTLLAGCAALATQATARATTDDTRFTIVTLNLWHDKADWPARRDVIVATLRDINPDVIALQEVLQHETLPNQATTLADALGYRAVFVSADAAGAARRYGNALLVRDAPIDEDAVLLRPLDDYRTAARVRVAVRGHPVDVAVTHLHWQPEGGAIRHMQLDHLLAWLDARPHRDAALFVAGDFNVPSDAPEIATFAARCRDAYDAMHPGAAQDDVAHTTLNPAFHPPLRIDHVFFDPARATPLSVRRLFVEPYAPEAWASDHFGVVATFRLEPSP